MDVKPKLIVVIQKKIKMAVQCFLATPKCQKISFMIKRSQHNHIFTTQG